MAGTTSRGYPFPDGPDQAVGSTNIQGLAEAVNTDVTGVVADIAAVVPAGAIMAWAGATAPPDWQLCDGTLLSRTGFSRLFDAIGTRYGEGDGVSTFAAPNLAGRFPLAAGVGLALNTTGGEETHTLIEAEMPSHVHGVNDPGHSHQLDYNGSRDLGYAGMFNLSGGVRFAASTDNYGYPPGITITHVGTGIGVAAAGGSTAHNNMPPYLALNYIVKL